MKDFAAAVVGVLADSRIGPSAGEHRTRADQQHRQHPVADSTGSPRVGDLSQGLHQGQLGWFVEGQAWLIENGRIGEDDNAGTGFQT